MKKSLEKKRKNPYLMKLTTNDLLKIRGGSEGGEALPPIKG